MGFRSGLRERISHLIAIHKQSILVKWIGGAWLLLGIVSLFKTEALSPAQQEKWQFGPMIPAVSLAVWIAIGLALLLMWIFEASFRYCKKVKANAEVERHTTEELMHELATIRTQQLPKLATSFDPAAKDCVDRVPIYLEQEPWVPGGVAMPPKQAQCMFYRLRVDAVSTKPVVGCRGRLVEVRRFADGSWDRQHIRDMLDLQWGTRGYNPIEVRPHEREHLDLFWIDEKDKAIHPVARHLSNSAEIFASHGLFQLDISISNEDGVIEKRTIQVQQSINWDSAIVDLLP